MNPDDPKNSPIRHQKFKSNSKLCQNQKLELMKNKYCYCSVKLRVCVNSFSSSSPSSSSSSSSYASNISFIAIPCTCRSMISHNICFCRIFDIFFLQTDRPTDRLRRVGIEAPSPELKNGSYLDTKDTDFLQHWLLFCCDTLYHQDWLVSTILALG